MTICAFAVPLSHLINHKSWELLVPVMIVNVLVQLGMVPPQALLTAQAYDSFMSIMRIEFPPAVTNLLAQTANEAHFYKDLLEPQSHKTIRVNMKCQTVLYGLVSQDADIFKSHELVMEFADLM